MASRVRSPMASRSHWLTETMMLRTSLPEALPVSSDSATDTSETPRRWNCSSRTARSFTDRVSRSSLATITIPMARDWTISRHLHSFHHQQPVALLQLLIQFHGDGGDDAGDGGADLSRLAGVG